VNPEAEARALLGVGEHADASEVQRAYRRLARLHHPDAGGDPAAFHRLGQARDLLSAPRPMTRPTASPSSSRTTRPSTSAPMGAGGWGESSRPRWHDAPVDLTTVAWEQVDPSSPHAWTRERVAAAAATPSDGVIHPVSGVSRRPGSRLNRIAGWLSSDLLARWWVRPAVTRGHVGHDVEVRLELPPGRARRLADEASWPLGWTRERRPSATTVTLVLAPSRDRRATALRAADALVEGLDLLRWPIGDWHGDGPG
jgi:hypothetical protein